MLNLIKTFGLNLFLAFLLCVILQGVFVLIGSSLIIPGWLPWILAAIWSAAEMVKLARTHEEFTR
jgi:hypothetical protein